MKTFPTLVSTLLALSCAAFVFSVPPATAATIHVDGASCTLADAIIAANTDTGTGGCPSGDPGEDLLVLDADLTLSADDTGSTLHGGVRAGLPDITDDLTIRSGLGNVIRRDPAFTCDIKGFDPIFRFLQLESGSLSLEGLRLEGGCFVGGDPTNEGGGIRAASGTELVMDGVTVDGHRAFAAGVGLQGGFLYTEGDRLTVSGSSFSAMVADAPSLQGGLFFLRDSVTAAIESTDFSDLDLASSISLQGGAIFSRGPLEIVDSTFEDLDWVVSGSLQGGAIYSSSGTQWIRGTSFRLFTGTTQSGGTTQGGAIYASSSALMISDSVFADFDLFSSGTCSGGALYSLESGPYERLIFERIECQSDSFIDGAAARLFSGATFRDCLFRANEGLTNQEGRGGALFGDDIELIERCAFIGNQLGPALSLVNPDAWGGAIVASSIGTLRNVTFAGNVVTAGNGTGADAGSAFGGALYLSDPSSTSLISAATFHDNHAIGGSAPAGFLDGEAFGGGLYLAAGHTAEVVGSILSGNTATNGDDSPSQQDCFADGSLVSRGFNLAENPDSSCVFTAFGDITGFDPSLYPVADYGCATPLPDGSCVPSAAIDQTSWAIDWSSCAEMGVGADGRDLARRQDIPGVSNLTADACDAGAFEARDSDGDGVTDVPDLCPYDADPDQSDGDGDLVGDACDACDGDDATGDSDGDLVCDDSDLCPGSDDGADADADAVPDGCDLCLGDDATGDADADFVCDDSDLCPGFDDQADGDGDGVPDGCDLCAGDDSSGDSDGDGLCDDGDAAVGDRIWLDDGNGVQDGGEPGVAGVAVQLYSSTGALLASTSTAGDGSYAFSPGPGDFYLEISLPADLAFAPRDEGADDAIDSDFNAGSGTTSVFTLIAGEADASRDGGLEPAMIGNRVWLDSNGDGLQQAGEPGLDGVTVRVLDAEDLTIATTTTGEGGIYGFLGLASGRYRIEVEAPTAHVFSSPDMGDDRLDSDVIPVDGDPATGRGPLFLYQAGSARQGWDAGLRVLPLFEDGFESGDLSAWAETSTGSNGDGWAGDTP